MFANLARGGDLARISHIIQCIGAANQRLVIVLQ
jgi:hypothetical protein